MYIRKGRMIRTVARILRNLGNPSAVLLHARTTASKNIKNTQEIFDCVAYVYNTLIHILAMHMCTRFIIIIVFDCQKSTSYRADI